MAVMNDIQIFSPDVVERADDLMDETPRGKKSKYAEHRNKRQTRKPKTQ